MGALSAMSMRSLNANTSEIASNWLPSIRALGELNAGLMAYRSILRSHMLAETLEEKQANRKDAGDAGPEEQRHPQVL